ncbi:MAG: hypothetical protein ABMB14_10260 [Myxococcota bacterium]
MIDERSGMLGLFLASLWLSAAVTCAAAFPSEPEPEGAGSPLASLRFWVLFALGFGLAGLPLALLSIAPVITLATAGASGAALGRVMWPLFAEPSGETTLGGLAGEDARVLLPVGPATGKVVVVSRSVRIELPARSGDGSTIRVGQRVLVAFVRDGVAWVVGY